MGYTYTVKHGRNHLDCDECGSTVGTAKHACPFGWCPPTALCGNCWRKERDGWGEAHKTCLTSSVRFHAEQVEREMAKAARLA